VRAIVELLDRGQRWLAAGGSQHTVYSAALGLDAFADLARMMGVELVAIR
jgi:L-arabinose isomerase